MYNALTSGDKVYSYFLQYTQAPLEVLQADLNAEGSTHSSIDVLPVDHTNCVHVQRELLTWDMRRDGGIVLSQPSVKDVVGRRQETGLEGVCVGVGGEREGQKCINQR